MRPSRLRRGAARLILNCSIRQCTRLMLGAWLLGLAAGHPLSCRSVARWTARPDAARFAPMPPGTTDVFDPGSTILRRDIYRGKIVSVWSGRAVHDTGGELAWAAFPGVEMLSRASYVEKLRTGHKSHGLGELAAGEWTLASAPLQQTTILIFQLPDTYFSVMVFFRETGELGKWYVNFERPYRRTAIGFDTCDLLVDLVIEPDGTYRWKDEDEYQQGRRLGIVDDTDHAEVDKAREQAMAMFEQRTGPFEEQWVSWRHDPNWTVPTLPANATTMPTLY